MKIKLGAVIPTVQYGNLQPEFELDENDINNGQGIEYIEGKIQELWDKYGEKPLTTNAGNRKQIKAFVGGTIYYDDTTHTYTNLAGDVYMSGSQYAASLEKPFELDKIADAIAKKFNADPQAIKDMWKLKGDVSAGFGTAIHAALELYGRYNGLAAQIDKDTSLHDHPVIKKAVQDFYGPRISEKAEHEIFIVDHEAKRAGQIDRLLITGGKKCRVQDFKTNADISKKLDSYWVQLEFYAGILKANGWIVEGLDIFHWDGSWHDYTKESK